MNKYWTAMIMFSIMMGAVVLLGAMTGDGFGRPLSFMQGVEIALAGGFCYGVIPELTHNVAGVVIGIGLFAYIVHFFVL